MKKDEKFEVIQPNDLVRLNELSTRIEKNIAIREEYDEYIRILLKYPNINNEVLRKINEDGYKTIMELYERKPNKMIMKSSDWWAVAGTVGAVLGVVAAAIYLSKKSK